MKGNSAEGVLVPWRDVARELSKLRVWESEGGPPRARGGRQYDGGLGTSQDLIVAVRGAETRLLVDDLPDTEQICSAAEGLLRQGPDPSP
jgi:hypothetical protein